jgi:hypothetical protein
MNPIHWFKTIKQMNSIGTYEELLPCGGKLKVTKSSWEIEYYFSVPDFRYNGTFFSFIQFI